MSTFNCPHCGKSIGLSVIGVQTESPPPAIESPPLPPTTTMSTTTSDVKDLVTTQQALNMKSKITVQGKIEGKTDKRVINTKAGSQVATCNAFLVDDSGKIKIQFWGDEVDKIQDGINIRITNGYTNEYKGDVSLTKGKYGQMEILA